MKKLFFIILILATASVATAQNNNANKAKKPGTGNFHVWSEAVKTSKTPTNASQSTNRSRKTTTENKGTSSYAEYEEIALKKPAANTNKTNRANTQRANARN